MNRLGEESVRTYGEYVSLAFEGREWTDVEQQRAADRFAHALRRLGLGPGDRAVVLLPNCPEVLQSYAAILKVGGVIVPVVFLLSPAEVRHILEDSEARVVVTSSELLGKLEGWTGAVVLVGSGDGGGMRDPLMGEEVLAFVTLRAGAVAEAGALIAFCEGRLAKYKCPKEVRFLDALPKSPIGKILRKELRAIPSRS